MTPFSAPQSWIDDLDRPQWWWVWCYRTDAHGRRDTITLYHGIDPR